MLGDPSLAFAPTGVASAELSGGSAWHEQRISVASATSVKRHQCGQSRKLIPIDIHGGGFSSRCSACSGGGQASNAVLDARRHPAADSQNRHRPAHFVGHHERIGAVRRFDPWLLVLRLVDRQRLVGILDVDHPRHEHAVGGHFQLVARQLDRNRIAQRQSRRRIESVDHFDRRKDFLTRLERETGDSQPIDGPDLHAHEHAVVSVASLKPPSSASAIRAPSGARIRTGWKYPDNGPPRMSRRLPIAPGGMAPA